MIAHLIHPRSDQLSQAQAFDEGYCTEEKHVFLLDNAVPALGRVV